VLPIPTMSEVPPELHSTICPNCGYALTGLSLSDNCPECGRAQSTTEVVLYGWARGNLENISNAKRSRLWWVIILSSLYFIANAFAVFYTWYFKLWILLWLFVIVFALSRRADRQHPGSIQVRLYPHGCVQLNGGKGPSPIREFIRAYGWILALLGTVVLAVWAANRPSVEGKILYAIVTVGAAAYSVSMVGSANRFRQVCRGLPNNAMVDAELAYSQITPWSKITQVSMQRIKDVRFRLQLNAYRYRVFSDVGWIVDAEIELAGSKSELLRDLISYWRARGSKQNIAASAQPD
jgi:hypothetical protein